MAIGLAALFVITSLLSSRLASANGGPPTARIKDIEQVGQDVHFQIMVIAEMQEVSIKREGEGYEKTLFENVAVAEGEETQPMCWEGVCHPENEECYDCNGDGETECYIGTDCVDVYLVDYVDECVYPGHTGYFLFKGSVIEGEETFTHNTGLDVVDTGEECDYDIDWGGDDGCSVSGLGSRSLPGLGLFALMLAVGLLALSRRRPR